jgi:hypothetical protein
MKKIDVKRRMREVMFTTEHTLNEEQRKKLIQDKIDRAMKFAMLRKSHKEQTLQS